MVSVLRDLRSIRNKQTGAGQATLPLTAQMQALVDAPLQSGVTRIVGYAGAAKTSTLIARARSLPSNYRMLYLAFTKSAQLDAAARFGRGNTECRTANSLAFEVVGQKYVHKLRDPRVLDIMAAIDSNDDWFLARTILDTLHSWCASAEHNFPTLAQSIQGPIVGSPDFLAHAAALAHKVWQRMVDVDDDFPMSHEGYLKLYQLSRPKLNFDSVALDEAQDTNSVTWAILSGQDSPLEIIGDPYQSIFLFRGAVNAMSMVKPNREFLLSQSFRFGPSVAGIANSILFNFFGEQQQLQGLGPDTKVGPFDPNQKHALIARTNATVFHHAAAAVMTGKSVGFVGGIAAYNFDKLVDVMHLALGQRELMRDHYLRGFSSYASFSDYAENANDIEAKRQINIVGAYGTQIESLVQAIGAATRQDLQSVDVVLSTAHRSKGLTMDYVRLADDFPELLDDQGTLLHPPSLDLQEASLLYVAITRARLGLMLNSTTQSFLHAYPAFSANAHAPISACDSRQNSLF